MVLEVTTVNTAVPPRLSAIIRVDTASTLITDLTVVRTDSMKGVVGRAAEGDRERRRLTMTSIVRDSLGLLASE